MKKFIILVCMAAVIAAAASVSDSLFAAGSPCQCFDDSTAWANCTAYCQAQFGQNCDDVLPFSCGCDSPFNGGECGCQYYAICENHTFKIQFIITADCEVCQD